MLKRALVVVGIMIALVVAAGCDRQPSAAGAGESGVQPILVEEAQLGSFVVERRFSGVVKAQRQLRVVVREPGEAVAMRAPGDSQPVSAGQELLRLRSPELELEVEEAESLLESAELAHQRQMQLADLGLTPQTEVEKSRAAVDQARIRLERLRLRQGQLTLSAPAGGLFFESAFPAPGQWCASGLEIGRIVDPTDIVVEVAVPSAWSERAREVERALLELGEEGEAEARAVSLSADVDPERGGRILSLRPAAGVALAPDALLSVRLVVSAREQVVTVPVEALVADGEGGWRVALGPKPGEQDRIRWVAVVPGPSDGRRTVLEQGIEAGSWVVLAGEHDELWWGTYLGVGR
jgi:hypothetical protein